MNEVQKIDEFMQILLVEDDDDHAVIISRWLAKVDLKIEISRVADGVEALDFLNQSGAYQQSLRPNLVLLDLKLPRLSGHEVLQGIKNNPLLLDIPVVVLTTSEARGDIERAYESHVNSYLVKPTDSDSFREMLNFLARYWGQFNRSCPV